jgi:two-component system response regulator FimZ (fimbrial Z protein)
VVLIGPCRLAQESLGYFLENEGIVDVVLNTQDIPCALDKIAGESPDVVVLDDEISPDCSKIVQDIISTNGDTHVIILARSSHHSYVCEAVDAGARAYVEKSKVGTEELASIIKEVLENNSSAFYITMERGSISDLSSHEHRRENNVLSDKELEIIKYIAEGYSNKEVGKAANISEQTVKVHVHNIFEKLGARDRAQAVALCFRKKLVM